MVQGLGGAVVTIGRIVVSASATFHSRCVCMAEARTVPDVAVISYAQH